MKKIDDLKSLPPEERIKRLKQIAEEDKKEIEEAQKLLTSSEDEAQEEYDKYQNIPVPQMRAIDIGSLFSPEEKQMFAMKRPGESQGQKQPEEEEMPREKPLEQTLEEEASQFRRQEVEQQQQYIHHLATATTARDLYQGIADLGRQAHEQGYLSQDQQRQLASFYQATREKEEAFQQGAYAANATTAKQIEHTLDLFHELKKNYLQ
jgi:hypothetical protein